MTSLPYIALSSMGPMFQSLSVSLNPIGPLAGLVGAAVAVLVLTLWAYMRNSAAPAAPGARVALSLRLLALLLCLLAALRPSVILQEKKRQAASLVFLLDSSTSMTLSDEVRGQTRWAVARKVLDEALETAKSLGPNLEVKIYQFDANLREAKLDEQANPEGRETDLGPAMLEADKREAQNNKRIARMVIISDFASNNGLNPLVAARRLRDQQVPAVTVGLGTEKTGAGSKDIAVRDIAAGPTVFVKNQLEEDEVKRQRRRGSAREAGMLPPRSSATSWRIGFLPIAPPIKARPVATLVTAASYFSMNGEVETRSITPKTRVSALTSRNSRVKACRSASARPRRQGGREWSRRSPA